MKLCEELSHPKERAIMGALFDCCYSIGELKLRSIMEVIKLMFPRLSNRRRSDPRDVCNAQQLGVEDSIFPPSNP